MTNPLVSIITPCYNGEDYVERYFESIIRQTYRPLELIFINDGSSDNTEKIAYSFKECLQKAGILFRYIKQENLGQAAALNRGLKLFTGEYLTWPDSDDVMADDCIEKKVRFLQNNPQYSLCICKTKLVYEGMENKIDEYYERIPPSKEENDNFFEDMLYIRNVYFVPGGYMIDAKKMLEIIPTREIYSGRGGQNAQILLPMLYYYKCGYMTEVLNYYYVRLTSHSHQVNDPIKTIKQIEFYENILKETLKRIDINVLKKYEHELNVHYSRMKFGNAIDSKNKDEIKKQFKNLIQLKKVKVLDILLYIKYTL